MYAHRVESKYVLLLDTKIADALTCATCATCVQPGEVKMKRFALLAGIAAMASITATASNATPADLRLDVSTSVSTTGGNWNNISNINATTSNLIDFGNGAGTGISITGSGWQDFFGDVSGTFPDQDWLVQPATADGAGIQQNSTGTFVFSGLTGASYRIEIVSARTAFDYQNTIAVDGNTADNTYQGTAVVTPWGSASNGLGDGNWLIWENVAPTAGSITITDVTADTLGMINAIRLVGDASVPTPEPMTITLFGAGLAGAAVAGRRRKKDKGV